MGGPCSAAFSLPAPSRRTRSVRLVSSALGVAAVLVAVGAGPAQAHDRGGREQWRHHQNPTQTAQKSTAAYVYLKKDARKPASWENSTQQYLVATWPGASYRDLTLDEVQAAVPAGVPVCGAGWGVQEDQARGDETVFTSEPAPSYPTDHIGWGPISRPSTASSRTW